MLPIRAMIATHLKQPSIPAPKSPVPPIATLPFRKKYGELTFRSTQCKAESIPLEKP